MIAHDFEYDELIERLRDNHTRRNQAQLFAFTASFALLAVLVSPDEGISNSAGALYLLPYVALIPLSCKIAYSRICHARIDAYLSVAYPGRRVESDNERVVPDLDKRVIDRLITYGVNFEPLIIGLVSSALALSSVMKLGVSPSSFAVVASAILFPLVVGAILHRGLDYSSTRASFVQKWKSAISTDKEKDSEDACIQ